MARDGFNINPATRIYHIVKFKDGSAYLFFSGCPWNCVYCVARTVSRWCLSISQARASGLRFGSMIGLREMLDLLQNKKVHTAFLGGEEPTYDPQLPIIMNGLKSLNINPWLITNGELLDDEMFFLAHGITFSIKALTPSLHKSITGKSNTRTLENFRKYADPSKVVAETVLYPGIVECDEALKVAEFIEGVNPELRFRIDLAVQERQLGEHLKECAERARQVHGNTYYFEPGQGAEEPEVLFPPSL